MRPEPLRGRKPSNTNRPVGRPLSHERGDRRRRPGHDLDRQPASAAAAAHQPLAGVGDARHPGVGDHGDPLAPAAAASSTSPTRRGLGVVVDAAASGPRRAMPGELEQPAGAPGVLAADARRPRPAPRRPGATGRRGCRSAWPTRTSAHGRRLRRLTSSWSPAAGPSARTRRPRPRAPRGPRSTGRPIRHGRMRHDPQHDAGRRRGRRRRSGSACRGCAPTGPAASSSAPSMPSRPSSPPAPAARRRRRPPGTPAPRRRAPARACAA